MNRFLKSDERKNSNEKIFEFHGVSYNPLNKESIAFELADLDQYKQKEDSFCWIDIYSHDISDLYDVLQRFNNDLSLEDHFEEPEILPRILEREDSLVFFLYEAINPDRHLDTSQALEPIAFTRMVLILSSNYIITFHKTQIAAVNYIKEIADENFRFAGKTACFVVFLFLQRCLYDYAHLNLANDNYLDYLETAVLTGTQSELSTRLLNAGQNILTLKKMSTNLQIILMLLVTKSSPFISNEAREFFREMLHNSVYTRQAIDSSRVLLDGVVASIHAQAASRTREIARVLTIVSAIFLPLTLIAGIYGMNFKYIPGAISDWGFLLTIGIMLGLMLIMLYVFYKMDLLGSEKNIVSKPKRKRRKAS